MPSDAGLYKSPAIFQDNKQDRPRGWLTEDEFRMLEANALL